MKKTFRATVISKSHGKRLWGLLGTKYELCLRFVDGQGIDTRSFMHEVSETTWRTFEEKGTIHIVMYSDGGDGSRWHTSEVEACAAWASRLGYGLTLKNDL